LIPFFFLTGATGTVISASLTAAALLVVGALTSRLTGRPTLISALRQLAVGASAALITYGVGAAIGVSVS
jgi:VIT1/CCC1 family predicted Fe2+/Mn2+ transporter